MNAKQPASPPPGAFSLRDVYYILFRHKWMIAILSFLGVVGALAIYILWPAPYASEAKLYIKYVTDTRTTSEIDNGSRNHASDEISGPKVMKSELEILNNQDLYLQVASNLTAARVLGAASHNTNNVAAATFIYRHFNAEVAKDSAVIVLRFTADNPDIVQPVLAGLIEAYKRKHLQIHLTNGVTDEFVQEQTTKSKAQVNQIASELQKIKSDLGVTDIDDEKKKMEDTKARNEANQYAAQVQLAQVQADIVMLRARISQRDSALAAGKAAGTKPAEAKPAAQSEPEQPLPPSHDIRVKYQNLLSILNAARAKEQGLLGEYTTNNLMVQQAAKHREDTEDQIKMMEEENPGLLALRTTDSGKPAPATGPSPAQGANLNDLLRRALDKETAVQATITVLTTQLEKIHARISKVDQAEAEISQLQSEWQVADEVHKHWVMATAQYDLENSIGSSRGANIAVVEAPTFPVSETKNILKTAETVLGLFLAAAFGLPFLIELVLDQSVKRPSDIQTGINLPVFINLPNLKRRGKLRVLNPARHVPLLSENGAQTPGEPATEETAAPTGNGHVTTWDERHEFRPFFEAMRDRLVTYFEMVNLTHKPKLVAVTSCGTGAGVTTTAVGLASSLSETGDGNVLLVSMDTQDGEAHHFYKGKLTCKIEDALEKTKRDDALVHENLYLAQEMRGNDALPRVLPKRFSHLVPKMKASDYDYIIFDMPPVSQISITPRLARFMDMVLLVVESEKTNRELATRTASLLLESKTHVGIVINKGRQHLPDRMHQDI